MTARPPTRPGYDPSEHPSPYPDTDHRRAYMRAYMRRRYYESFPNMRLKDIISQKRAFYSPLEKALAKEILSLRARLVEFTQ